MVEQRHSAAFEVLVERHRRELHAHCYRMLGSVHDADDALQDALVGAWRGFDRFEGRSSPRTWLFAIATNAALRVLDGRRRRVLPGAEGAPADPRRAPAPPLAELVHVEPYPDEHLRYEDREGVELAYVAALQLLPPNQRAVLLLRDALGFSAAETAEALGTSVASTTSALQRARAALATARPERTQQATLRALGDAEAAALAARFVDAWNRADVAAIVALLREDVRFSMPPSPTWLRGRGDVATFLADRVFRPDAAWRFTPATASGQLAMAGRRPGTGAGEPAEVHVLVLLTLDGAQVAAVDSFFDR